MTHPISLDALEAHTLVVGTTGSGKTYLTRGVIEQLRRADRRVAAIDKMGNLWGVTASADGKSGGLELVIFGGKRAHVPMTPADGAKLGRLFAERGFPAIFDVSQWPRDDQERWVADFADALFMHNEVSTHIILDEAQSWVPLNGGGDAFKAIQRLAEQGRGNGIHLFVGVQRLSRLDATVRGMMQGMMVALKTPRMLDRKAIRDDFGGPLADISAMYEDLPNLPAGTGWVYDPVDASLRRVGFPRNTTFDSSRTPRHGDETPKPIGVSSALVEELRKALAPPAVAAPQEDVIPGDAAAAYEKGSIVGAMLAQRDRQIVELEAENNRLGEEISGLVADLDRIDDLVSGILKGRQNFEAERARRRQTEDSAPADADDEDGPMTSAPFKTATKGPRTGSRADEGKASDVNAGVTGVTVGETTPLLNASRRKILDELAWGCGVLQRPMLSQFVLAKLVGKHQRTKGFLNDRSALKSAGLIHYPIPGEVALTDAGAALSSSDRVPPTIEGKRDALLVRLSESQRSIIGSLQRRQIEMTREALATSLSFHPRTKGFMNALSELRTLGLITYPIAGRVALSSIFGVGA